MSVVDAIIAFVRSFVCLAEGTNGDADAGTIIKLTVYTLAANTGERGWAGGYSRGITSPFVLISCRDYYSINATSRNQSRRVRFRPTEARYNFPSFLAFPVRLGSIKEER